MQWDIFCRVIDNFGDLGVCWRLCADLGARGHSVRLWVDDAAGLQWMAPGAQQGRWPHVQVLHWNQSKDATMLASLTPAEVWVEAFGCDIPTEFVAWRAQAMGADPAQQGQPPVWINLEYLSAEPFVERSHGLPSPILRGPAQGWTKYFFYPGFTKNTGGLLREPDLLQRQHTFVAGGLRAQWLAQHGVSWAGEPLVSLFCYEPRGLPALLAQLDAQPAPVHMLVTAGRAQAAVRAAAPARLRNLRISYLPALSQTEFDELLWTCDLNFVRGEDSLVRALWAGKPLVWHIYQQEDDAQLPKLDAFLDAMDAPPSWRAFHHAWNSAQHSAQPCNLPLTELKDWTQAVQRGSHALAQTDDLLTRLLQFILKKR